MLREQEREHRSAGAGVAVRKPLVCAACGHEITDDTHRIEMGGAHEHTFVNPAGFAHHIACFAAAPGCALAGAEETAFSWFPGWSWQLALCARCGTHLGWTYHNAALQFWGLIVAALRRT